MDARALEALPGMRCLAGCESEPVWVTAVPTALARLNRVAFVHPARLEPLRRRGRGLSDLCRYVRPGLWDDTGDAPPRPVAAMPHPRVPPAGTLAPAMPA